MFDYEAKEVVKTVIVNNQDGITDGILLNNYPVRIAAVSTSVNTPPADFPFISITCQVWNATPIQGQFPRSIEAVYPIVISVMDTYRVSQGEDQAFEEWDNNHGKICTNIARLFLYPPDGDSDTYQMHNPWFVSSSGYKMKLDEDTGIQMAHAGVTWEESQYYNSRLVREIRFTLLQQCGVE